MADGFIARSNRRLRPFGLTVAEVPVWLGGLIISLLWAAPFVWMVAAMASAEKSLVRKPVSPVPAATSRIVWPG